MPGAFQFLRRLRSSGSGTALIEFAVAFPVLLVMYIGSFTLSDAMACNRKVTIATRTVTDLTTRFSGLSDSEIDSILNASSQMMLPYSASNAQISVSQIKVTDSSHGTVSWSRGKNTTALAAGTVINIPNGISAVDTYLIVGSVTYTYTPPINFGTFNPITFTEKILLSPRLSDKITRS